MSMSEMMRQRAEQKLAEAEGQDQSWEAKNQRALDRINRQLAPRIQALRVVLPATPPVSERHQSFMRRKTATDFVVGHCRFCNPPPQVFKCPLCDWETLDKWRMKLHNEISPKWCRDRAAKKARKWAQHA